MTSNVLTINLHNSIRLGKLFITAKQSLVDFNSNDSLGQAVMKAQDQQDITMMRRLLIAAERQLKILPVMHPRLGELLYNNYHLAMRRAYSTSDWDYKAACCAEAERIRDDYLLLFGTDMVNIGDRDHGQE